MPHRIVTKDGIVIEDIPDEIAPNDPRVKDQVAQMRSAGKKSATFGQPLQLTPDQYAALDPESAGGAPPAPVGQVKDLVMSPQKAPAVAGAIADVAQGAGVLGRGMIKGAASVPTMIADPITMLINKALPAEYQQLPPSEGLNLILKKLGVPESETKVQEILEAAGMGIGAGAAGIGAGAAMAAGAPALGMGTATQEIGKTLASGPLQQMLGSVGAEEGATIARQQGAGPLVQFGAGLAGGVAGGLAGNLASLKPGAVNPMQGTVDDSAKLRTQLMTSDVFPPKTFAGKTGQALAEKIPVIGTGPIRATQQADRIKDVKDLLRQFGAEDAAAASDDVMSDLLEKRGASLTRWTGMKNKVIDELSIPKIEGHRPPDAGTGAPIFDMTQNGVFGDDVYGPNALSYYGVGDDSDKKALSIIKSLKGKPNTEVTVYRAVPKDGPDKITPGDWVTVDKDYALQHGDSAISGGYKLVETKVPAKELYGNSDSFFEFGYYPGGKDLSRTVPMTATTKKIDDSITFLNQLKTEQVKPVIAVLEDWKQAIQGQDLKNIELLRKQIGETFTAPEMAAVRSTGERVLSDIYGAVKEDMTSYIGEKGGQQALNKWQIANKELSKMMGDLDLGILKSTLEKGVDRPEVVKNMLFSKDRSVIQALNKNLTAKGRESARSAIMQEVGKKIGEEASPEKFLSEMRKMKASGDPVGVFFSGDDLKAIEGLTRVLKATTRASQAGLNPPTGVQAVIPLSIIGMGGGSVALEKYFGQGLPGLLASVGLVGTAGAGARLYESPAVRNILMKLPTVKPGSVEEAALFKRLLEAAQAIELKENEER